MAAKVFQIIAIVVMVVTLFILILILPFISRMLKKLNKSFADRRVGIRSQMTASLTEMEAAQGQIEALSQVTASVKDGLDSMMGVTDKAVAFLRSNAFQFGLPVVIWLLLLVVAIPRGVRGPRPRKKPAPVVIPPPSWEDETP